MLNKKLYIPGLLLLTMLAGSCKKFLTQDPLAEVAESQFFKSKYDVDASVSGMYKLFQDQMVGEGQYKDRYHIWGEHRSDNFERFVSYTTPVVNEITLNGLTPDNEFASWTGLYNVIYRANVNIKKVAGAAQYDSRVTKEVIDKALAESYAMRAMAYFYIVRVWGDAPIWTEPYESLSDTANRARESASKIIDEVIIKDLDKAYSLTLKNQTPIVWSIGEGAICALMADVYMWKKDYPNAIKWFQNLFKAKAPTGKVFGGLAITDLQPTATWKQMFTAPDKSIESIWTIDWSFAAAGCACMSISYTPNNKQYIIDLDVWNKYFLPYQNTAALPDVRVRQTHDVWANNRDRFIKYYNSPANPTAAYTFPATPEEIPAYVTMYRLGDMYLLYAEALNGNGDLAGALKYLNFIRKRAGVPEFVAGEAAVASKEAMEDAILQERQYELYGEGKRWFDLVRTNHVQKVMDPVLKRRQAAAGSDVVGFPDLRKIVWPINRSVLNANKKLIQNEAYTD
ncbi:RagB/SusD family nutrient uptake outer membrane protein [Paraflavitalea sp. CAU 1676]|uniref:RagB/SusD family nutrient uptake outer membrane protein n=1 Tax=Paraflavitalea sp. CAU 1676 TaxID=3032598 RepID=UPI0023DADAD4|nr:RagB/SusD family nutrient uptake outer membrane protein [Paraflavitalea sp. CAU 1676]MDF2193303.1 RagB/SusD family nutrient uptake outer membrane protein [Paraflavitalea sp. CAU 1676]